MWLAQRNIPIGTAYAVWTGIGALGTFLVGILWFGDSSNIWRMLAASFLLIGIIGLKLAPGIDVVFGSLTGVREKPFPSAFRIGGLSSVRWLFSHTVPQASEGMRQSPRGEREMVPTLGPSGMQLRLNCWRKKRRMKMPRQRRMKSG